jgi:hypothetical protein
MLADYAMVIMSLKIILRMRRAWSGTRVAVALRSAAGRL